MATLPPEIILDILLKLPVKSLCRFRCISKSCLALITDPRFVKMHLSQSRMQRLAASCASILYFTDHEAFHDHTLPAEDLEFPKYKKSCSLRFFGSCNGLLCVSVRPFYGVFYLYNPSTTECKKIPDCEPNHRDYSIVGFGYAESIDDYKFLIKRNSKERFARVFSLRKNSWRNLSDDLLYKSSSFEQAGIPLNGAIHWVFIYPDNRAVIAAFDLVEEKFKALPLPDYITSRMSHTVGVGVLGGCLFLYKKTYQTYTDEIWVMQEYGVKESWTRKFSLTANPTGWPADSNFQPLCCRKNSGKMFLATLYMRKDRSRENDGIWMDFVADCFQYNDMFFAQAYVESLVSPNCLNDSTTQGALEFSL